MLNSSTQVPTDAELQRMVYGGDYQVPESREVREHRLRREAALSDRDIEEQATPESVRAGLIDLYDDRSDLDYLAGGEAEATVHGSVTSAEHTHDQPDAQVGNYDHRAWMESLGEPGIIKDIAGITPVIVFRRNQAQAEANR